METLQYPTETKAIKDHKCNYCGLVIQKGEKYLKSTYKHDTVYSWKAHIKCNEIAQKLQMFDDCDEGLTGDDFRSIISEVHFEITRGHKFGEKLLFSDKLEKVIAHYLTKD